MELTIKEFRDELGKKGKSLSRQYINFLIRIWTINARKTSAGYLIPENQIEVLCKR